MTNRIVTINKKLPATFTKINKLRGRRVRSFSFTADISNVLQYCKFTMITMITMMVMMIMGSAVWRIASPNWRRYRISPCDSKFDHFHDNRRHANRPLISFVITCHVPSPTWQETTVRRLISLWINLAECVMETRAERGNLFDYLSFSRTVSVSVACVRHLYWVYQAAWHDIHLYWQSGSI